MTNIELFHAAERGDVHGVLVGLLATAEKCRDDGVWSDADLRWYRRNVREVARLMTADARGARARIARQLADHGSADTEIECETIDGKAVRLMFGASCAWEMVWA